MFEILLWESQGGDGDCVSGVCMSQVGRLSVHWSCPVWGDVSESPRVAPKWTEKLP